MPRAVSTAFANAVAAGVVRPVLLMEALFDSGALRFWTGIGDLTWAGSTWIGSGAMIAVDDVEEGGDVQARGTKITLPGLDPALVSIALAEPIQNRPVTLWLALLDDAGAVIASPDKVFQGRADTMTIVDDGATCTVVLTAESLFVDLQRARSRRYEHQDQQLDYPGDMFFEFITQIQDQQIQWGPKG